MFLLLSFIFHSLQYIAVLLQDSIDRKDILESLCSLEVTLLSFVVVWRESTYVLDEVESKPAITMGNHNF